MNDKTFIKTSDEETARQLSLQGFTKIDTDSNGIITFVNNGIMTFSDKEQKKLKLTYSNMLNL